MLTYDYRIWTQRSGGFDVVTGTLDHRYGDGAWELLRKVIDGHVR